MSFIMKVVYRKYCYDCRRRASNICKRRGSHNWYWDYYVLVNGKRLKQQGAFANYQRASASADRSVAKLKQLLESRPVVKATYGYPSGTDRAFAQNESMRKALEDGLITEGDEVIMEIIEAAPATTSEVLFENEMVQTPADVNEFVIVLRTQEA